MPGANDLILSLDFGGTKLSAGLVKAESGSLLSVRRFATLPDAERSLEKLLSQGRSLLAQQFEAAQDFLPHLAGVGVSFGGLVDSDGRTIRRSHHIPGWEGFPLAARLETEFQQPARVVNDADAAALGEFHLGAGQGVRNLLYMTLSTGIGGGIILDGALYRGENALAGEIGHMILQPEGPLCPCGRRGCLEALASGLSIAREMRQRLALAGSLDVIQEVSAQSVAQAAAAGDPLARSVWAEAMRWLGMGIANAANLLNPGCVVLGGGLTRAGELLFEPVQQAVAQLALHPSVPVRPAALGDDGTLLGAAMLFHF